MAPCTAPRLKVEKDTEVSENIKPEKSLNGQKKIDLRVKKKKKKSYSEQNESASLRCNTYTEEKEE